MSICPQPWLRIRTMTISMFSPKLVKDGKQIALHGVKIIGGEEIRPSAWLWETA